MPKYKVWLSMPDKNGEPSGFCWHIEVPVEPRERLSVEEIERRAVELARQACLSAFGHAMTKRLK
jgi:hypothetical protein